MMWEPVPVPRKRRAEVVESRLRGVVARVQANRALLARHYSRTFGVTSAATGVLLLVLSPMLVTVPAVGHFMWIPWIAGIGLIGAAAGWPSDLYECTCERCHPTEDLR